jgi:hypothetical protein
MPPRCCSADVHARRKRSGVHYAIVSIEEGRMGKGGKNLGEYGVDGEVEEAEEEL